MRKEIYIKGDRQRETLKEVADSIPDGHLVSISEIKSLRSLRANRYYWGCIIAHLADHMGTTKAAAHNEMKHQHLYNLKMGWDDDDDFILAVEAARSIYSHGMKAEALQIVDLIKNNLTTTKLRVKHFAEYVEEVKRHTMELGVRLPTMEEYNELY